MWTRKIISKLKSMLRRLVEKLLAKRIVDNIVSDIIEYLDEYNSDRVVYDRCYQDIYVDTHDDLEYIFTLAVSDEIIHKVLEELKRRNITVDIECDLLS